MAADREHAPRAALAAEEQRESIRRASARVVGRPRATGARPDSWSALEPLPVLDRVHRAEEALVGERDDLATWDQPRERLLDELVAGLDPVEELAPAHEEAAVDPHVGALIGTTDVTTPSRRSVTTRCALNSGRTERNWISFPEARKASTIRRAVRR